MDITPKKPQTADEWIHLAAANHTRMQEDPVFRAEVEKKLYAGPEPALVARMQALFAASEKEMEKEEEEKLEGKNG